MTTATAFALIPWDTVQMDDVRKRLALGLLMSAAIHVAFALSLTPVARHFDLEQPLQVDIRSADTMDPAAVVATDSHSEIQADRQLLPEIRTDAQAQRAPATTSSVEGPIPVDLPFERYYSSREVDLRAEEKNEVQIVYPKTAYEMRVKGAVRLRLYISAQGNIDDISLLSSDPPGIFEEHALAAARALEFRPAVKDGRSVRSQKVIEVFFDPYESINVP